MPFLSGGRRPGLREKIGLGANSWVEQRGGGANFVGCYEVCFVQGSLDPLDLASPRVIPFVLSAP